MTSAINFSGISNQSFIGKHLRLPLRLIPKERVLQRAKQTLANFYSTIFLSTYSREINQACCELLSSLGYKRQSIGDQKLEEFDEILAVD